MIKYAPLCKNAVGISLIILPWLFPVCSKRWLPGSICRNVKDIHRTSVSYSTFTFSSSSTFDDNKIFIFYSKNELFLILKTYFGWNMYYNQVLELKFSARPPN